MRSGDIVLMLQSTADLLEDTFVRKLHSWFSNELRLALVK